MQLKNYKEIYILLANPGIKISTFLTYFFVLTNHLLNRYLNVFLQQSAADIESKINLQKKRAKIRDLQLQPFLLVEGPIYTEINKIYIVINDIKYAYENCLKALDVFFKLFHVMGICYPLQSEHIYETIEIVIFNSQRKSLKRSPYIQDIQNIKIDQ